MNKGLELFDMLALFSIVEGLYNLDLNLGQDKDQKEDSRKLQRIEQKLDLLLKKTGEIKDGYKIL